MRIMKDKFILEYGNTGLYLANYMFGGYKLEAHISDYTVSRDSINGLFRIVQNNELLEKDLEKYFDKENPLDKNKFQARKLLITVE